MAVQISCQKNFPFRIYAGTGALSPPSWGMIRQKYPVTDRARREGILIRAAGGEGRGWESL